MGAPLGEDAFNMRASQHIDQELFAEFLRSQGANGQDQTAGERRSWQPVDLGPILAGNWQPPQPTVGRRADGKGLFYPGKGHTVISETEGGKTWFALCAALDEMRAGNHVLYIDFEDDEGGVTGRLLTLGASRHLIREWFHYIRPEHPLDHAAANDLREVVVAYRPTFDILDGITEAMVMHGLNPLDNRDAALFGRRLPRPLASFGAAVASLDHVKRDGAGGRYAIGAVHKLNALDGAGYLLENRQPFGVGIMGRSVVKIAKDRPGQLRRHALPSTGGIHRYGDLVPASQGEDFAEVSVEAPHDQGNDLRPTELMGKISAELGKAAQPMPQRELLKLVRGRDETKREAFARLVAEGYVNAKTPHTLLNRSIRRADSVPCPSVSRPCPGSGGNRPCPVSLPRRGTRGGHRPWETPQKRASVSPQNDQGDDE